MLKYTYRCVNCSAEFMDKGMLYLCPECEKKNIENQPTKGVLNIEYNYSDISKKNDFNQLKNGKFLPLLPIDKLSFLPPLKIGNTPLYKFHEFDNNKFSFELYLKDDTINPTLSLKDRASALVSAIAKQNKLDTISTASTGNAGSSLAGICASQSQEAVVFIPASAPVAKITQSIMYGATVVPVYGNYDDAFNLSIHASKHFNWYNRNTAYNPFTIEGKKTVAYEIYDQLDQKVPDRIFVSVGDGVILSGIYKAFEELLKLNIIRKIPEIVAVQAEGSANIIYNLDQEQFKYKESDTIADSISVNIPANFYMAKYYLQKYKGNRITVTDNEILSASSLLSKNTGIFAEPAAAAAFAGFLKFVDTGNIKMHSKNVVLLTGNGLKDLHGIHPIVQTLPPVKPVLNEFVNWYKNNKE